MTMTEQQLPDGWSMWQRRGRLRIGWTVSGLYELEKAAGHVQAEARTFPTDVDYDPEILRRWSLSRRRAVRWIERAISDVENCPRTEWLDARFASGSPDAVLTGFGNGDPIAVRY